MDGRYEAFLKTAELGSISRAAEYLGFSQSGLSRAIAGLEEEFGFSLFIRGKQGVRLTANGERVLAPIRRLFNEAQALQQTVDDINGLASGVIRVGTFTSVTTNWLPGLIDGFTSLYPGIEFRLRGGDYEQIGHWLERGEIDCGFLSAPAPEGLSFLPLLHDPMLAVLPPGHPLAAENTVSCEALACEDFISLGTGGDYDLRRALALLPSQPRVKYTLHDDLSIVAMVAAGQGVSIMPALVLRGLQTTAALRPLQPPCCRVLGIASRPRRYISPAVSRFLDYLSHALAELLVEDPQGSPPFATAHC